MPMRPLKTFLRAWLNGLGFEVYRYPQGCERLEPHLRLLLPRFKVDFVIDVGANRGQFAAELRRFFPRAPIHSIEPQPAALAALRTRASEDHHWHIHDCALGRAPGRAQLHLSAVDAFSSILPSNDLGRQRFPAELVSTESIEITLITLADFIEQALQGEIGQRPLLKLDTQGMDLDVLVGAGDWLDRFAVIVLEASLRPIYEGASRFEDLHALLRARGFALTGFFPVSRADDLSIIEADAVFVRT